MTSSLVQEGIINHLAPFLEARGYIRGDQQFNLREGDFSHGISYSWIIGDRCRPTSFGFRIASRSIGIIIREALGISKSDSYWVILSLNQKMVFGLRPKEFPVDNEEDIVRMCDTVKEYLLHEGFEYYERHRNLELILGLMKEAHIGKYFLATNFMQWSLNFLAISRYLGDPDYDSWLRSMQEWIYPQADPGHPFRDRFDRLVLFLEGQTSVSLQDLVKGQLPS